MQKSLFSNKPSNKPSTKLSSQPITVAVTGPEKMFTIGWWTTRFMLSLQGLRAVYLTAGSPKLPRSIQGIIIGGGDDIEPVHYGGAVSDTLRGYDKERDRLEMQMIERARAAAIPILGICRGAQLINVVAGGTLFNNIRSMRRHTSNRRHITPVKWITLSRDSQLRSHLGVEKIKVNSLHHQAVNVLGKGLRVTGEDKDGIVQAIESQSDFVLGVQWHPEYLPYSKYQRQVFAHFANAVRTSSKELSPF